MTDRETSAMQGGDGGEGAEGLLPAEPPARRVWTSTPWSSVARLDSQERLLRDREWSTLVSTYQPALETYLGRALARLRGRPCSAAEAAEVTQDFLGVCVEKGWLMRADPARGPFRAFLQTLLRRFAHARVRFERAQRRHPSDGARVFSLREDEAIADVGTAERPELAAFDRSWAEIALERARVRLRKEHARYVLVIEDLIRTDGAGSPDMAQRLRVRPAQLAVLRHRARRRFLRLFEEELRATVADEEQFAQEWRTLRPYLP